MKLAEELWLNHSIVFNDGHRGVPDGDFQEAIDEALAHAAQECDHESENLSGNNARTADACASRIRALISGDGQ